jgi:alkylhydroperoxidase family enzyme
MKSRLCVRGSWPDDELFARLQQHYDDDTIAELTMIIAWENASSRFNRAFRIPSQGFWKR